MQNAETVLAIIRERGRNGLHLERVYRQLFNRQLYLLAYGKIYRNHGATTAGVTAETVDGMSLRTIDEIIDQLRSERYRWTPVRRTYIEKKGSSKKRPLGIPTWPDKLVQEVIRLILEAYYEPQFSDHSHGFRAGRGCHTALKSIRQWRGTKWFIEGDISDCFGTLEHSTLISILSEKIHDGRFLRLIGEALKAGYLEDWQFNATLSGAPQGGLISPVLTNVYLDRLDKFVEETLMPVHNVGTSRGRKLNPAYLHARGKMQRAIKDGRRAEAKEWRRTMQSLPCYDPKDPNFRRLKYLRYADDFLLGYIGPRKEAESIKQQIGAFLSNELKLKLSDEKTLITHAVQDEAAFLGYEISIFQEDHKRSTLRDRRRSINGKVRLEVPTRVVTDQARRYLRDDKPFPRPELLGNTVFSIVDEYQLRYRGIVEYYRMAHNLHRFNYLNWVMGTSLTKTLAQKLNLSVNKVWKRYGVRPAPGEGKVLQVRIEREDKEPLVAQWGGISLARNENVVLNDQLIRPWNTRTEVVQRLLADTCEICGSTDNVEVHHIRKVKDLKKMGKKEKPLWAHLMSTHHRKTLVVCRKCHEGIHHPEASKRNASTGELDDGKLSYPVRRGTDGKVPSRR